MEDRIGTDGQASTLTPAGYRSRIAETNAARALGTVRALGGATPRLIDEWQRVPPLWAAVRGACDARAEAGQFILTGSATPSDHLTRHSGALRIQRLALRTMSLTERGLSTAAVSPAELLRAGGCAADRTGRGVSRPRQSRVNP